MFDIIKQTIEEAISNVENIITNIDSDLKKVLKKLYTLNNGETL